MLRERTWRGDVQRESRGPVKPKGPPTTRVAVCSPALGQFCSVTNHPKMWPTAGIHRVAWGMRGRCSENGLWAGLRSVLGASSHSVDQ